ncbi:hypothetical protein DCAR_0831107 [Daucus carota subsp. sativus]|uniref:Replication factor A C-terminal domain-containing protein n=1 Tax=Daucus carota subsp. sativus TaxID=79200 RepID=A0AAF1BC31_DAUCS|nr:hypothetical protein DCAR_0831107 [Daucus carota subsp. sativus]
MNWFCNYCIPCDVDLEQVGNRFKCPKCGKFKPYPDRRYEFSMLCSNKTGTIPILWSSEELTRFTGKTVYDVLGDESQVGDGDKFPPILQQFEKKSYAFTLCISKENVLQGSNLYTAIKVTDPAEMWESLDNTKDITAPLQQTEISQDITMVKSNSPSTGESTNKTKSRKTTDPVEMDLPHKTPQRKAKHVKIEKVRIKV